MSTTYYISHDDFPAVLTVEHIQMILKIGRVQAYELIKSNQFHSVKIGKSIRVSKEVFLNWLNGITE